jgi:hypothetical protein
VKKCDHLETFKGSKAKGKYYEIGIKILHTRDHHSTVTHRHLVFIPAIISKMDGYAGNPGTSVIVTRTLNSIGPLVYQMSLS